MTTDESEKDQWFHATEWINHARNFFEGSQPDGAKPRTSDLELIAAKLREEMSDEDWACYVKEYNRRQGC
jgi:hypothetical protein